MQNSGCGPTACADVVATLINKTITPWTLAQLAMQWGDRTVNDGTAWSFFKHIFNHYKGFSKFIQTSSLSTMKACLDAGGYGSLHGFGVLEAAGIISVRGNMTGRTFIATIGKSTRKSRRSRTSRVSETMLLLLQVRM